MEVPKSLTHISKLITPEILNKVFRPVEAAPVDDKYTYPTAQPIARKPPQSEVFTQRRVG